MICGDFNRTPQYMEKSGWLKILDVHSIISLPDDQHTCFMDGKQSSNIDFAMVNKAGADLIEGIEAVHDVPWKPHIGLMITIKAQAPSTKCRMLDLPTAFSHPKRKGKPPTMHSKRQAKKRKALEAQARREAEAADMEEPGGDSDDPHIKEWRTTNARWEALTPAGWTNYPEPYADVLRQAGVPVPRQRPDDDKFDPFGEDFDWNMYELSLIHI